jgi:hypothetical protein
VDVTEIAAGLWRWTAPHPEWREGAGWPRDVGCVYYEAPAGVVLIDPLVPADERERDRFFTALDRDVGRAGAPVHVLRTLEFHERSIPELVERYGASTELPGGVEAVPVDGIEVPEAREQVFWLPEHAAIVPGDTLLGADGGGVGVCPPDWIVRDGDVYPAEFLASLRRLLDLPIERILISHGDPVLANGRAALDAALQEAVNRVRR